MEVLKEAMVVLACCVVACDWLVGGDSNTGAVAVVDCCGAYLVCWG